MPLRTEQLSPEQRLEIIKGWRHSMGDPGRVERCRRWALDILTEGMAIDAGTTGPLDELTDQERADYLDYVGDQLAYGLLRFLSFWVMADLPLIEDWRRHQRRSGIDGL